MAKGGMGNLMKQAQKAQQKMAEAQEQLGDITVEGTAGGGMVTVTANGNQEILEVDIEEEVMEDDVEILEDLIVAAVNQALEKASEAAQEKMNEATGGLLGNLPKGMNIPGL
ncbi:MAG: YbaB/EbfC family nucleoid-associated protein [Candidatus Marinimicrobia bacterium]|nr:YbaB/EbfC family nucleoid-associated protein [Candidatus Neomarinimicrobiota bacterium]MCF7828072.1 YbaB/EbfC family nucleoid-associated protein [Candidatus Neomarinimicrobiota bacterium]MCF7879753.1 YbaB/EbfC family nucleoid-associated protein [Candidatus Neomarinimicrobiota bacterium]